MSFEEVEPQWLSDYREQVLEARESEREDDFRGLDRDEKSPPYWMSLMWLEERDDG